jgi:hypothetical protein
MRDPLFSVHTTDSGKVCLYLEEQDACLDVVEDVLNFNEINELDELKGAAFASLKEEGAVERLDRARANLPEMALKIAVMSEDEAFNLCQDIISSIKKRRIFNADEMATKVQKLRLVE